MKILRYLLILILVTTSYAVSFAQIHIDVDENVGIGTTNVDQSKLRVLSQGNSFGLKVYQNYNSANHAYGFHNYVEGGGIGTKYGIFNEVRQNVAATGQTNGIYSRIYPYGTGTGFGILNILNNVGTGNKYGYYGFYYQNALSNNVLYGSLIYLRNYGTGISYADYKYIYGDGLGTKEGYYLYLRQNMASSNYARGLFLNVSNSGSGTSLGGDFYIDAVGTGLKYGIRSRVYENANSLGAAHGIFNQSFLYGAQTGYGIYNRVEDIATSAGQKFGIYSFVEDITTSSDTKYGIYSYVQKQGAGTNYALWSGVQGGADYAGYFSGNVVVTGTMTDGISDARLKEKVNKLEGALGIISKLKPKSYEFKKDMGISLPQGLQYGLIAQELEEIVPQMVTEFEHPGAPIYKKVKAQEINYAPSESSKKETLTQSDETLNADLPSMEAIPIGEEYREEIVGYEDSKNYKAINYKALIPVLIGAMQEQQTQIETLKKEVSLLKSK